MTEAIDKKNDNIFDNDNENIMIDDTVEVDHYADLETSSSRALSATETTADETQVGQKFVLAPEETTKVNLSKCLVIFVLFLSVTVAAVSTYILSNNQVRDQFETQFEEYASEVATVSQLGARDLFDAYLTLSLAFTSSAIGTNSTWPFVTIPVFEALGHRVQERVNAQFLGILPFVTEENREKWEKYTVENQWWIHEGLRLRGLPPSNETIKPFIFDMPQGSPVPVRDSPRPLYAPLWQTTPVTRAFKFVNFERYPAFEPVFNEVRKVNQAVFSPVFQFGSNLQGEDTWPHSILAQPVHDTLEGEQNIVALVCAFIPWHVFFKNILPDGVGAIILTVNNNCGQVYSYQIEGPKVQYLGTGTFHDSEYDSLEFPAYNTTWKTQQGCGISLHFYPTDDFKEQYSSTRPILYTVGVVVVFLITAIVFELYDCLVQRRQQTIMTSAAQSHAIVNSFFPSHVRDRILENQNQDGQQTNNKKNFVTDTGKPIAELHPHCTILIADIVNFTAWSSVREPAQVFTLLETLYAAFDVIAKKRKVFKVETIGDAYVAVAGLPEPRDDHAVVMARFANTCMGRMNEIVLELETSLGPDTAELTARFGLHSGPVTAGVLRGERARFQLFGDTINTAARIESTGMPNKVHMSEQAANELKAIGKGHWVVRREGKVIAKGKGELQTYWLDIKPLGGHMNNNNNNQSVEETESSQNSLSVGDTRPTALSGKEERLVSWHVDVLSRLLKQIVARRPNDSSVDDQTVNGGVPTEVNLANKSGDADITVLDEVKEIIPLPNKKAQYLQDPNTIELSPEVMRQLRRYVNTIASMYRPNSFHSFEHASHVAQSLTKLLSRVVAEDTVDYTNMSYKKAEAEMLHKFTYGIASDPLTQFACAFSALIHDVDHRGVPNTRLVQEEPDLATLYKRQSVAEQNSVDLSWELLMEAEFKELRSVIYTNQDELDRFRQLVVNSVMATDIVDKELGQLRKNRWNKAFHTDTASMDGTSLEDESEQDTINRKATIVIEHLIQAADVAHTMQHWHVYLKWNERFFHENYQAYLDGRLEKDPSIGWYQGEIGFFDFYIIPLAKKLESCGVFGVSSDECLDYATANRIEWETKGKDIVEKYMLRYKNR